MNRSLRHTLTALLFVVLLAPSLWLLFRTEPGPTLLQAAYEGDVAGVQMILQKHPELVNYRPMTTDDLENRPPWSSGLDTYVWKRKVASTESLADLSRLGFSPMHMAVYFNHADVVDVLLKHQANLELTDVRGRTPLSYAFHQQLPKMQFLLINAGADVNVQSYQNMAPLHWGVSEKNMEMVKLLLARGAQPEVPNAWGVTPLMLAVERGQKEMADELIRNGASLEARDGNGRGVLRYAMRSGDTNLVMYLQNLGATR